jgi:hypothetical protein
MGAVMDQPCEDVTCAGCGRVVGYEDGTIFVGLGWRCFACGGSGYPTEWEHQWQQEQEQKRKGCNTPFHVEHRGDTVTES